MDENQSDQNQRSAGRRSSRSSFMLPQLGIEAREGRSRIRAIRDACDNSLQFESAPDAKPAIGFAGKGVTRWGFALHLGLPGLVVHVILILTFLRFLC